MYKEILRSMDDAAMFSVVAIVLFFAFFVVLLIYVIKMDKNQVAKMAAIPLDEDPQIMNIDTSIRLNGKANNA